MEHTVVTSSPSPTSESTGKRNVRTPFVTPCRRLGLSRKSPSGSGIWHASKSSPSTTSPYKSPLKPINEFCDDTQSEHSFKQNQMTPTKCTKTLPTRQVSKKFKTTHSNCQQDNNERNEHSSQICPQSIIALPDSLSKTPSKKLPFCDDTQRIESHGNNLELTPTKEITEEMIKEVHKRVKEKEESIKDLRLIQLYKKKHDVNTLHQLIHTWREGCQIALQELLSVLLAQGHQLNMEELLAKLNIPHELVKYKLDMEDFE